MAGDDELRVHLADVHELDDDPGTTTSVQDLQRLYVDTTGDVPMFGGSTVVAPARVYDQASADARWRPISLGIGGVLLTGLIAAILLLL